MVIDFTHIKQVVKDQLDHRNLNEVLPFNPVSYTHLDVYKRQALKPTRSITIKDVNFMGFIFVSPLLYNISTL